MPHVQSTTGAVGALKVSPQACSICCLALKGLHLHATICKRLLNWGQLLHSNYILFTLCCAGGSCHKSNRPHGLSKLQLDLQVATQAPFTQDRPPASFWALAEFTTMMPSCLQAARTPYQRVNQWQQVASFRFGEETVHVNGATISSFHPQSVMCQGKVYRRSQISIFYINPCPVRWFLICNIAGCHRIKRSAKRSRKKRC